MGALDREPPSPLLERGPALADLRRWFDGVAQTRAGRAAFVSGEAGVGKTRLVRELAQSLPQARVLTGACDALATPAPMGPLLEVAATLDGAAAALASTGARPYELARALLDDLVDPPPSLVVLEDLHWADDGTIDALAYLVRRIEQVPALVICTYRDDELVS